MTVDDQIKDEKRQYDINREAAKIGMNVLLVKKLSSNQKQIK